MMKKFGIMLISFFVAATALTSCNESSSDFAQSSMFAVVHTGAAGLYFESDDHKLLYPANNRVSSSYIPKEGGRVIISYNLLEMEQESLTGFDYYIDLYSISDVRWGEQATVSDAEELKTYGEEPVLLFQDHMVSSTREILNMALQYYGTDAGKHDFTIIENNDPEYNPSETKEGYKNLELRHKTSEETTMSGYAEWISIPLDEFELDGYRGLIIGMTNFIDQKVYVEVDFTTYNDQELKPAAL